MIRIGNTTIYEQMVAAMKSGDEALMATAWEDFHQSLAEQMREDFSEIQASSDANILAQRGYRLLTSDETKFYQKMIDSLQGADWKQSLTKIIGTDEEKDLMPTTILEDVYKDLEDEFPLLAAINFQYVGYLTKWILNDHATQMAVWGKITDEITKEITSAFRVIDINQNKLSAFAFIELGILDLGPVFLDGYIRTVLVQALMLGLEFGFVLGTGVESPIGLIRDIHEGVAFSTTAGYPEKDAIAITSFMPVEYGALLAKLAKTERGKNRKLNRVALACTQADYLTKVMPATTVLTTGGNFVRDLFPYPTDVYISNVLEDGTAVLFLPDEYSLLMATKRNGVIDTSDEFKFLDDVRYFKIVQYGAGRCFDNTCAFKLDISGLKPAYITVQALEIPEG